MSTHQPNSAWGASYAQEFLVTPMNCCHRPLMEEREGIPNQNEVLLWSQTQSCWRRGTVTWWRVWIPDMKVVGTVIRPHEIPRSVDTHTPNGKVRRNRRMTRRAPKNSPRPSLSFTSHDNPEPSVRHGPVTDPPTTFVATQEFPVSDFPDISDAIKEASRHLPTPGNQTVK